MSLLHCIAFFFFGFHLTNGVQTLKFLNPRGIPDQVRLFQSPPGLLHPGVQGPQNLEELAPTVATCALRPDCHLATSGMSLTTAGEMTTGRPDRPRRVRFVEGMGIGRGTGHQNGMTVVTAGALGRLMQGIEDTEAQAPDPVAHTMKSPICPYLDGLRETYQRCRFSFLRKLTGMTPLYSPLLLTPC